jgi:hypothetical protein
MRLLTILIFSLFFSAASWADKPEFQLIGKYLLEYSFLKIDVYEISYLKSATGTEKLVLDYKMGVKKKHSIEGWKVGLKHKESNPELTQKIQWIHEHTADMEKGDRLSLVRSAGTLEMFKNDSSIAKVADPVIAELAFEPWLGEPPIDAKLKASLLGQSKEKK